MNKSAIQYADYSWNPATGCLPGLPCWDHCWARAMHTRFRPGVPFLPTMHPEVLDKPFRTRKPGVVAVSFGGDLFAIGIDDAFRAAVFGAMAANPQHTFLVLTKRPERMAAFLAGLNLAIPRHDPESKDPTGPALECAYCLLRQEADHHPDGDGGPIHCKFGPAPDSAWPLPNVLLGFSAWDQDSFDRSITAVGPLAKAGWRLWASLEPMVAPIDPMLECVGCQALSDAECPGSQFACNCRPPLDWVVLGGELGPGARPLDCDWVRKVRDSCRKARVPFMFKQLDASKTPATGWCFCDLPLGHKRVSLPTLDGQVHAAMPGVPRC